MNVGEQFTCAVEVCPVKSDGGHQLLQGEVTKLHLKNHPSDEALIDNDHLDTNAGDGSGVSCRVRSIHQVVVSDAETLVSLGTVLLILLTLLAHNNLFDVGRRIFLKTDEGDRLCWW